MCQFLTDLVRTRCVPSVIVGLLSGDCHFLIQFTEVSELQSWPKCVGQSVFFPNCAVFARSPLPPPMQCWTTRRQAFPYEQHCMGGGGESRIWPKERWFPCEKLIDGRGSAFCKLVPHNFGQDCSLPSQIRTTAIIIIIIIIAILNNLFGQYYMLEFFMSIWKLNTIDLPMRSVLPFRTFPWIIGVFNIWAYYFYKVAEMWLYNVRQYQTGSITWRYMYKTLQWDGSVSTAWNWASSKPD